MEEKSKTKSIQKKNLLSVKPRLIDLKPDELLQCILYLRYEQILTISLTSKFFYDVCRSNSTWKILFDRSQLKKYSNHPNFEEKVSKIKGIFKSQETNQKAEYDYFKLFGSLKNYLYFDLKNIEYRGSFVEFQVFEFYKFFEYFYTYCDLTRNVVYLNLYPSIKFKKNSEVIFYCKENWKLMNYTCYVADENNIDVYVIVKKNKKINRSRILPIHALEATIKHHYEIYKVQINTELTVSNEKVVKPPILIYSFPLLLLKIDLEISNFCVSQSTIQTIIFTFIIGDCIVLIDLGKDCHVVETVGKKVKLINLKCPSFYFVMFRNTDLNSYDILALGEYVLGRFITRKICDVEPRITHYANDRSRLVDLYDGSALFYYRGSNNIYHIHESLDDHRIKGRKLLFDMLKVNIICGLYNGKIIVVNGVGPIQGDSYPSKNISMNMLHLHRAKNVPNMRQRFAFNLPTMEGISHVVQLENGKIMLLSYSLVNGVIMMSISVLDWFLMLTEND